MTETQFISNENLMALMAKPLTTEELVAASGLKIRTLRARLTKLIAEGKVKETFTLKDMRKRRYMAT